MSTSRATVKDKLVRVTAWIPKKKLGLLMKEKGKHYSQSDILRMLIDNEIEKVRSWKVHERLYGIAKKEDFFDEDI